MPSRTEDRLGGSSRRRGGGGGMRGSSTAAVRNSRTNSTSTSRRGGGPGPALFSSVMRPPSLPLPDKLVGTKIGTSLAAERALETGDELEDALWMGSEQFDGANVRQQLRRNRAKQRRSTRSGAFSSALTSMRFGFGGVSSFGLFGGQGNSSRRATATNSPMSATSPTNTSTPLANTSQSTAMAIATAKPRRLSLEYNGGHAGAAGSSAHHLPTPHLPGHLGHGESPTLSISRSDAMRQQQMLLSMRCEASRSTRRIRTYNGQSLIDWFMEEAIDGGVKPMAATAGRVSRKILPWRNSKNSKSSSSGNGQNSHNSNHCNNKLQRKNLQKFNLMEQKQCSGGGASPDSTIMVVRQMPHNVQTNNNNGYDSDDGMHSNNPAQQSTNKTSNNKKKKKKWRLWLPNQKEPIELVHPSEQQAYDFADSQNYNFSFRSAATGDSSTSRVLPADLKLKQQIALQKQRQSTADKASRHLELQFNDISDNNLSNHHQSQHSGYYHNYHATTSNITDHTGSTRTPADILNGNNSTDHSNLSSWHSSSHHSNNMRSTRFDVQTDQPLLVRTSRIALKTNHDSFGSDSFHNDNSSHKEAQQDNSSSHNDEDPDSHNYSPLNARKMVLANYLPKHIQMRLPKSRGSMLVQQVSALSFAGGGGLDDDDDDDDGDALLGDNSGRIPSSSRSVRSTSNSSFRLPPARISDHAIPSSIRDTSVYGVDFGDDDDEEEDDQFYNIQELMDASNNSRQRRRTLGVQQQRNLGGSAQLVSSSALDSSFTDFGNGSLLHELWCSDSDMDNMDELMHAEFQNLSTQAARSEDGDNTNSSRRTQQPSEPQQQSSSSLRRHANATGQSRLTSYRNKNKGIIRLECLHEEEDDNNDDNTHHLQSRNDSDPSRGADPQFGGSTRKFGSIISTSAESAKARQGSLASSHASHDSSCSFSAITNLRVSSTSTGTTNSSSVSSGGSTNPNKGSNHHRANFRRKTLPFGALGSKQNGIRGGIIKDYAEEFLSSATSPPSEKKIRTKTTTTTMTSTTDDDDEVDETASTTTPPLRKEKPGLSKGQFIPPAPLMTTNDKPLPMNNRRSSLPEQWRVSNHSSSERQQQQEKEDDDDETEIVAVQRRTQQPTTTYTATAPAAFVANNTLTASSSSSTRATSRKGSGKAASSGGGGGDWWRIDEEVEQGIWRQISSSSFQLNNSTTAEDNKEALMGEEDNNNQTHVYVVWDEDGEKDPYVFLAGEELPPAAAAAAHQGVAEEEEEEEEDLDASRNTFASLPLDLVRDMSANDDFGVDTRSVCSEPAHMGMLVDETLLPTTTAAEKKWLLAWDDLALLR